MMNLPLSCLSSLAISFLGSFISDLVFVARGTKITLFKVLKEVLQEEREWLYLRPV